jgi:hypothetical protein
MTWAVKVTAAHIIPSFFTQKPSHYRYYAFLTDKYRYYAFLTDNVFRRCQG